MKKAIFTSLVVVNLGTPAFAGLSPVYECSGSYAGQAILADVLNASSGQRYIQVEMNGDRSFYLVDPSTSIGKTFIANQVEPKTGQYLDGVLELKIPSVLMNKATLEINGLKVDLKCRAGGIGGVHAY